MCSHSGEMLPRDSGRYIVRPEHDGYSVSTGLSAPDPTVMAGAGVARPGRKESALSDAAVTTLTDDHRASVAERLVGTWTTVLDNDGTPVVGLSAFNADGGVILTQLNAKNIGLGNWVATGVDTFVYNAHILAADENGGFKGTAHITVNGTLTAADSWTGDGGATFHDADGQPLRSHGGSAVTATKYHVGQ